MGYSSGLLKDRVTILNRKKAVMGKHGLDSSGIGWEESGTVWASVEWAKGKQAMNAGSIDVYGVVMVRMRWNSIINERSKIRHNGKEYVVLGDTFHADKQANTIQFHAQAPSVQD